jgi:hypothetical protein
VAGSPRPYAQSARRPYDAPVRKAFAVIAAICAAATSLGGCSALPSLPGHGDGGLRQALRRIAANADTRAMVMYDATGQLTKLVGKNQRPPTGFGTLRLTGTDLAPMSSMATADTGIALPDADYEISAGKPPKTVALVAGGQHADRIGSALTTLGWSKQGDRYLAPDLSKVGNDATKFTYVNTLGQVRPDGGDVIFGSQHADLGNAGHPDGRTLADDKTVGQLADCLGDVVAAQLVAGYRIPAEDRIPPAVLAKIRPPGVRIDKLTAVAVGVRTPKSASETPRAIVCTAWSDGSVADAYARAVPGLLAGGTSYADNQPYSKRLHNPETKNLGGDAHVVQWSADLSGQPSTLIYMLNIGDLPGLL